MILIRENNFLKPYQESDRSMMRRVFRVMSQTSFLCKHGTLTLKLKQLIFKPNTSIDA